LPRVSLRTTTDRPPQSAPIPRKHNSLLSRSQWMSSDWPFAAPAGPDASAAAKDIVHELQAYEIGQLLFKQKETLMSRHLPLIFPPPNYATRSQLLPIAEVMVGASRHKEISRVSVETLLRQKVYQVPVTVSKAPFQLLSPEHTFSINAVLRHFFVSARSKCHPSANYR
jgi:hypothetical protein